ncbi:sphingomyelin phosphodiesterase [Aspergillus nomiae NRRL 13137]|uniref:Sphingomyelin phosphodiesterase n=1 Tax=Aspergillus nomiae NRRL (strain ATCC 15546 / NRRL 13137 / CBS 260.88 / M93) TaxID=1509407 RepID=A0A0L1J5Y2_ASPN3|nr:sphingomyelin phosphodiesterase [Aspergillus nomiae NRRL 13137]KNG87226.1 sphingomyelin phosphodiesterase [Aspergillus nomiae NRRL 13137]
MGSSPLNCPEFCSAPCPEGISQNETSHSSGRSVGFRREARPQGLDVLEIPRYKAGRFCSVSDMRPAYFLAALASVAGTHANPEADLAGTIWDDIKGAVTCAGCEGLLGALKLAAGLGQSALENIVTGACKLAAIEDNDVCEGAIKEEGTAVYYALKNLKVGSHTSKTFCSSIAGLCEYPDIRPYNLTFPVAKSSATRPPPSGQSPIRVAHISDTHVDLQYTPGANAQCTKPICCRSFTPEDAPGNTSNPCGLWGDHHCDPPLRLEDSMMDAIAALNPTFSIYTGDVPPHDIWMVNQSSVLQSFNSTYSNLGKLGVVYAALGNHDTAPVNLFPSDKVPPSHNPQWAYDALASDWASLVEGSPSSTTKHGSYSIVHPNSNLRIISYNSVFYYKYNFYAFQEPMEYDPDNQLQWLISELQAAETAGQRVWMIAHIPTGNTDTLHDYSHYLDQIINRYSASIAALFFGHTHTDLFQISTNSPNTPPKWVKYYSAKEAYGSLLTPPVTDPKVEMTPAFWHKVTVQMEKDDSVFQAWWSRTTRGYNVTECTGDCAKTKICSLRGGDAQFNCEGAGTPFKITKRSDGVSEVHVERPFCEDAVLARIVGGLTRKGVDAEKYVREQAKLYEKV